MSDDMGTISTDGRMLLDVLEIDVESIRESTVTSDLYTVKRNLMFYESFIREHGRDIFRTFDNYCQAVSNAVYVACEGVKRSQLHNIDMYSESDHITLMLRTYTSDDDVLVAHLALSVYAIAQERIVSTPLTVKYCLEKPGDSATFSRRPEVRIYYD